jgi:lipoprotein
MVKYVRETSCLIVPVSWSKKERRMIMIPIIAVFGCFGIGCLLYAFKDSLKSGDEKKPFTFTRFRFMMAGFGFVLLAIILYLASAGRY